MQTDSKPGLVKKSSRSSSLIENTNAKAIISGPTSAFGVTCVNIFFKIRVAFKVFCFPSLSVKSSDLKTGEFEFWVLNQIEAKILIKL